MNYAFQFDDDIINLGIVIQMRIANYELRINLGIFIISGLSSIEGMVFRYQLRPAFS